MSSLINKTSNGTKITEKMFIYDLPCGVRIKLCEILDLNDKWEELGGSYMGFKYPYIQSLRKKKSPTDILLTDWGDQNHTVKELFILLYQMNHFRALTLLIDYVPEKYQRYLKETELTLSFPSCNTVRTEAAHFNEQQCQQNIQYQRTNSQGPPCNVQQNQAHVVYSNEANEEVTVDVKNNNLPEQKIQNKEKDAADYCRQIPFAELEIATNSWDSSNILGRGGFGTVFKGTWKNTTVAIKKLVNQRDHQMQSSGMASNRLSSSMREVVYLTFHRHVNILDLYGCSISENFTCLVYEYMDNGSLEDCLHRKPLLVLDWTQRLNIMIGTARGLQFLHIHCNQPLVHGDIKSANILLDNNFKAKIGDFGLAQEGPAPKYTHVKVSKVHGTKPYLPSEYLRYKKLSVKVDTYSFGVVLFEVATGLRAHSGDRKKPYLKDHVESHQGSLCELADRRAGPSVCVGASLMQLGLRCADDQASNRPDMARVLQDIEQLYRHFMATQQSQLRVVSGAAAEQLAVVAGQASVSSPPPLPSPSMQPGQPVFPVYVDALCEVSSSVLPKLSELGFKSEPQDEKGERKVQARGNQSHQVQEESEQSQSTDATSERLTNRTEPSNQGSFSVSLPNAVNDSANMPKLSELF